MYYSNNIRKILNANHMIIGFYKTFKQYFKSDNFLLIKNSSEINC